MRRLLAKGHILVLFVAVLASQAAPTSAQAAQPNDIRNFRVTNESENKLEFLVDYSYSGDHGDNVWIGAYALSRGQDSAWFGYVPAPVQKGSGQVTVKLIFGVNDPPPSLTTDQVKVDMYVGGKGAFFSKTFDYAKTWSTQAAPTSAQATQGTNDIRNVRVTSESDIEVEFVVDYSYSGDHGDVVMMGAEVLSRGQELIWFGYAPAVVQKGSGQVTVRVDYGAYDPPPSVTTDQVQFYMYDREATFFSEIFDYVKTWSYEGFGYLSITSSPSGARVLIDGVESGVTPFNDYNMELGSYNIQLVKEGYDVYEEIMLLSSANPRETIRATLVESGTVIPGLGEVNKMWLAVVPVALGVLGFLFKLMRD